MCGDPVLPQNCRTPDQERCRQHQTDVSPTVEKPSRMRAAETRRRKTATIALALRHILYIFMHTPFSPTADKQELDSESDARGSGHCFLCWRVTCLISYMCQKKKIYDKHRSRVVQPRLHGFSGPASSMFWISAAHHQKDAPQWTPGQFKSTIV